MNIYIANIFAERDQMPAIAQKFEDAGHVITHPWWNVENIPYVEKTSELKKLHATLDANGVLKADLMVLLNTGKSEGKAVEQGLAIAKGLPIIAVGTPGEHSKNIFHWLPNYKWVSSVDDALAVVNAIESIYQYVQSSRYSLVN